MLITLCQMRIVIQCSNKPLFGLGTSSQGGVTGNDFAPNTLVENPHNSASEVLQSSSPPSLTWIEFMEYKAPE
jgi:hypothetical protein